MPHTRHRLNPRPSGRGARQVDAVNVRVEVTDNGGGADPHYVDDPHGEHGRGLPILVQLSRSWGFDHLDDGRLRVWFEVVHTAVPNGRTAVRADTPRKAAPTPPRPDDGAHEEPPASSAATAHPADR